MKKILTILIIFLTLSVSAKRFYSPEFGRFITQDPVGVEGGLNLYNSVSNNMVNGYSGWVGYSDGTNLYVGYLSESPKIDPDGGQVPYPTWDASTGKMRDTTHPVAEYIKAKGGGKITWAAVVECTQEGLEIVGMIPVLGEVADGANAVIYLMKGDLSNAALSASSMIPVAGNTATGKKIIDKIYAAVDSSKLAKVAGQSLDTLSKKVDLKKLKDKAQVNDKVDPTDLRFTQPTVSPNYSTGGHTITSTVKDLQKGRLLPMTSPL